MERQSLLTKVLVGFGALLIALPLFWLLGGIRWLDTQIFPPRRPKNMPQNAVWIDAPALPFSWHHGWWFGCDTPSSGTANYCRLVMAALPFRAKRPAPCLQKRRTTRRATAIRIFRRNDGKAC